MAAKLADELKSFQKDISALRAAVREQTGAWVSKSALRNRAEELADHWFEKLAPQLIAQRLLSDEDVAKYSELFQHLIKLSSSSNRKSSYEQSLGQLLLSFRKDVILPAQTRTPTSNVSQLHQLLGEVSTGPQSEYFAEATRCADYGLFRGAAILGWCAAIDQIHHAIDRIGFSTFNTTSASMASQTVGRFKKFNQVQNAHSLSELREVFDTITLWILEGMQLIDVNQHTRLRSCFDLRNQCAHPGEAPVTEYNLLSFFSDLNEIVFKNPKLARL